MSITVGDEPWLPLDVEFFFWKVDAVQIGQSVGFNTRVFSEGELGRTADTFWDTQLKQAQRREQLRENPETPVAPTRGRVHDRYIQDALERAYHEESKQNSI